MRRWIAQARNKVNSGLEDRGPHPPFGHLLPYPGQARAREKASTACALSVGNAMGQEPDRGMRDFPFSPWPGTDPAIQCCGNGERRGLHWFTGSKPVMESNNRPYPLIMPGRDTGIPLAATKRLAVSSTATMRKDHDVWSFLLSTAVHAATIHSGSPAQGRSWRGRKWVNIRGKIWRCHHS